MIKLTLLKYTTVSLLLTTSSYTVIAQENGGRPNYGPPKIEGWQVDVGIGSIISPEYLGASDYRVMPIPYIDVRYGENLFLNVPKGLGGYVVNSQYGDISVKLGAAIAPNFFNRDAEDFPGLSEVKMAAEARGYGEFKYGNFSLDVTVAQDVGTGHDGAYSDISLGYGKRLGDGFFKVSGSVRLADKTYMNSFYTVTAADSITSGLNPYRADSGLERFSLSALYAYEFNDRWRMTVITNADFLQNKAKASPIVEKSNSVTVISALTYRF